MVATVVMKFLFTHCEFQQDQTDIVWDWLRDVATHKVTKKCQNWINDGFGHFYLR